MNLVIGSMLNKTRCRTMGRRPQHSTSMAHPQDPAAKKSPTARANYFDLTEASALTVSRRRLAFGALRDNSHLFQDGAQGTVIFFCDLLLSFNVRMSPVFGIGSHIVTAKKVHNNDINTCLLL